MGLDILICLDDAPDDELTQIVSSVEVYEKLDQNTTYKLHFMVDICKEDIAHSLENATTPGKVLSVLAKVKDELKCLVKGPITQQEAHLVHGGEGSWIKVDGEDTGYYMDRKPEFNTIPSVKDSEIAQYIIEQKYSMLPDVETTADRYDEENQNFAQINSDMAVLRKLAQQNGFHFWITYSEDGISTGHFRSRDLNATPKLKLKVNLDENNIDSLHIRVDSRMPSQVVGKQLDVKTKEEIGGGEVTLTDTVLGLSNLPEAATSNSQTVHLAPAIDSAASMQARSVALLRETQWFINATCRTSLHRLCGIVNIHTIVEIMGAGKKHSGKYYVSGVKHTIDASAHAMELELQRNGWGA